LHCSSGDHARQKEAGKIISYYNRSLRSHCPKQSISRVWFAFNKRIMQDSGALELEGILRHSIQDEAVNAIACPSVVAPQGLQNDQGLL
jgi:hypothetical protein